MNCIRNFLNKEGVIPYIGRGLIIGAGLTFADMNVIRCVDKFFSQLCPYSGNSTFSQLMCLEYTAFIPKVVKKGFFFPFELSIVVVRAVINQVLPSVCTFKGGKEMKQHVFECVKYLKTPHGNAKCDYFKDTFDQNNLTVLMRDCRTCPINIFASVALQELVFGKIIQQQALPAVAKRLPNRVRVFFEHPIIKVSFTAALFSLTHLECWGTNRSVEIFISGLFYGTATEITGEIFPSIVAHFIWNYIAKELRSSRACAKAYPLVINATKILKQACD